MAKTRADNGSWPFAEELLQRGDPAFVREVRRLTDAERLGTFAGQWWGDRRPEVRQLLFDYLDLPLNAFRHEALVKRLFKFAWEAQDDEVLARFMVCFDRSLRRVVSSRWRRSIRGYQETLEVPSGTAMWRPGTKAKGPYPLSESQRQEVEKHRLFTLATRRYLRRRAWRYFRLLGKHHPEKYVPALLPALKRYTDEDVSDGVALLDNWGLVHVLFHHSPVLQSRPRGWLPVPGRSLRDLEAAPMYESLWLAAPRALLELVRDGKCRPVRQWALHLIRRNHGEILKSLSIEELFSWLRHSDPLIVNAAAEVLREMPDLASVGVERLLSLVEEPNPETIETICDLLSRLPAQHVTLAQATRLACQRPLPLARLGLTWLRGKITPDPAKMSITRDDCQVLLSLVEAEAVPLRPEIMHWLRTVLGAVPDFPVDWVLEFLDSRHDDVRDEGWHWLIGEPRVAENVSIWQKLLESPYDDVRLRLVEVLEALFTDYPAPQLEHGKLDPDLIRLLWATVLLNAQRGGRKKPQVVSQIVRRLLRHPEEAPQLLPLLGSALRSVRGPEWRAGLAGLVQVVQQSPGLRPLVEQTFPELKFAS